MMKINCVKCIAVVVSMLFWTIAGQAQYLFEANVDIPVTINNQNMVHAWAGGLNAAQYQTMDLNNDSQPDLVIFDRTAGKLMTFLNVDNTRYQYNSNYEFYFPSDINNWMVLADYNCDGKKDIFTNTLFGMKVYKNITTTFPEWELVADPIFTLGSSSEINLQVNESDIPGINDLDGDGDLDILVFNFFAGRNIEFHQNMSMEKYGLCDSLDFQRVDRNWGKFEECDCGDYAFNQTCSEKNGSKAPINARPQHAGGKALLAFDNDGDGDKDILFGDEDCVDLIFFENKGTNQEALIQDFNNQFPDSNSRISFPIFPAAYYEDINFDGVKDLLVSPNTSSNLGDQINFVQSSWLYLNIGANDNPTFTFSQNDFIQNFTIDIGENAYPVFLDIDQDNDQDLLLSGRGIEQNDGFYATVFLFENKGDINSATFELVASDYLDFSVLRLKNLQLLLADFNDDGLNDLLFTGSETGQNLSKSLYFIPNTGTSNASFQYKVSDVLNTGFSMSANDNVHIIDLNNDNKVDLLLGKATGKIQQYENNGEGQFTIKNEAFFGIDNDIFKRNPAISTADLNDDKMLELIITDATGAVNVYDNFLAHLESPALPAGNVIANALTNTTVSGRFGKQSWTGFADLNNDKIPEMLVGSILGGVQLFLNKSENKNPDNEGDNVSLTIFPNPVASQNNVMVESNRDVVLAVYNILGQIIKEGISLSRNQRLNIDISTFSDGLYLIHARSNSRETTRKFLVQK